MTGDPDFTLSPSLPIFDFDPDRADDWPMPEPTPFKPSLWQRAKGWFAEVDEPMDVEGRL